VTWLGKRRCVALFCDDNFSLPVKPDEAFFEKIDIT